MRAQILSILDHLASQDLHLCKIQSTIYKELKIEKKKKAVE